MVNENEIIEFFNRIINVEDSDDKEVIKNVNEFYKLLGLTKMCDEDTLEKMSRIVLCINELLNIKNSVGEVDVSIVLNGYDKSNRKVKKKGSRKDTNENKHYKHYESGSSSSSCGTGSRTYSSHC